MVSKMPVSRSLVVPSTQGAIVDVFKQVLANLQDNSFTEEDIFAVHLALEEAFINAIRHGNKMESTKAVKIDFSIEPDKIEICMTDEGEGFDPTVIPDPRYGDNLYKPAGRGMLLIRSYMDVVEYNKRGNSIRMVRYRVKPNIPRTQAKMEV